MKAGLAVPVLIGALLCAQLASLVPAWQRAQIRIAEAVYADPESLLMARFKERAVEHLLDGALRKAGVKHAGVKPSFESTASLLIVRFGVVEGDARKAAEEFRTALTAASLSAMLEMPTANSAAGAAELCRACVASARHSASQPIRLVHFGERRGPWLRPMDLLAAAIFVLCLVVWLRARRTEAPAGATGTF